MDCSLEHQCSTTDAKRSRSASTASFQNSVAPLHTHNQHTHTLIPDTTDRTALLSTWKNRLSGLFSTTPTENTYRASTGDLINGKRESKYWRPMPLQEPNISMKKLYFTHSRDGCVMIVGADKTSVRSSFDKRICPLTTDCVQDQHKSPTLGESLLVFLGL